MGCAFFTKEIIMKKFIFTLVLILAFSIPAFAAPDCAANPESCRCVGVIYKDPDLSAPNDLFTVKAPWDKAGSILSRHIDWDALRFLVHYEQNGSIGGPSIYDNQGGPQAPWDAIGFTFVPEAGEADELVVALYDRAPEFSQRDVWVNGSATTDVQFRVVDTAAGLDGVIFSGVESLILEMSNDEDLIDRGITAEFNNLRADILANGCP